MRWAAVGGAGLLLLGLVCAARSAVACAGCRNPSMASSRGSEGPLAGRAVRLGASLTGTTVHVVHESGCKDRANCAERPIQELYLHDQHLYPVELRISGEYGINETFGVELQVPFRSVTTTIHFAKPDGSPYAPLDADVHHRDETVVGPADSLLMLRVGAVFESWWLAARPGLSLPLGRTEQDPFELGDRGLRHQHIQLGSGTFDPVLMVEASRKIGKLELGIFAQAQASLYENTHGYRAPWKLNGGASLGTKLLGNFGGSLGLEAFHEDAERWKGEVRQDGNLGRSELLGAASLRQTWAATELQLTLRFPLWREIVVGNESPGTLSSPLIVSLGLTHTFGGAER